MYRFFILFLSLFMLFACSSENTQKIRIKKIGNKLCNNILRIENKIKKNSCKCSYHSNYIVESFDSFYKKMCLIVVNLKEMTAYLNGRNIFLYQAFSLKDKIEILQHTLFKTCKHGNLENKKFIILYLNVKKLNIEIKRKNLNKNYSAFVLIDIENYKILDAETHYNMKEFLMNIPNVYY